MSELRTKQQASGHFVDSVCTKCSAPYYVNTRYPQVTCAALVDHQYCTGEIVPVDNCKKCGGDMKPSKAIVCKATGTADFAGAEVVTVSPDPRQPVLIDCSKCEKCGWSVTNG